MNFNYSKKQQPYLFQPQKDDDKTPEAPKLEVKPSIKPTSQGRLGDAIPQKITDKIIKRPNVTISTDRVLSPDDIPLDLYVISNAIKIYTPANVNDTPEPEENNPEDNNTDNTRTGDSGVETPESKTPTTGGGDNKVETPDEESTPPANKPKTTETEQQSEWTYDSLLDELVENFIKAARQFMQYPESFAFSDPHHIAPTSMVTLDDNNNVVISKDFINRIMVFIRDVRDVQRMNPYETDFCKQFGITAEDDTEEKIIAKVNALFAKIGDGHVDENGNYTVPVRDYYKYVAENFESVSIYSIGGLCPKDTSGDYNDSMDLWIWPKSKIDAELESRNQLVDAQNTATDIGFTPDDLRYLLQLLGAQVFDARGGGLSSEFLEFLGLKDNIDFGELEKMLHLDILENSYNSSSAGALSALYKAAGISLSDSDDIKKQKLQDLLFNNNNFKSDVSTGYGNNFDYKKLLNFLVQNDYVQQNTYSEIDMISMQLKEHEIAKYFDKTVDEDGNVSYTIRRAISDDRMKLQEELSSLGINGHFISELTEVLKRDDISPELRAAIEEYLASGVDPNGLLDIYNLASGELESVDMSLFSDGNTIAPLVNIKAGMTIKEIEWMGYTPITCEADLAKIAANPDGKFYICCDLDLSKLTDWVPIGDKEHPFTGEIYGNYCTISNFDKIGTFIAYSENAKFDAITLKNVLNEDGSSAFVRESDDVKYTESARMDISENNRNREENISRMEEAAAELGLVKHSSSDYVYTNSTGSIFYVWNPLHQKWDTLGRDAFAPDLTQEELDDRIRHCSYWATAIYAYENGYNMFADEVLEKDGRYYKYDPQTDTVTEIFADEITYDGGRCIVHFAN